VFLPFRFVPESAMRGPIPEGLYERLFGVLAVVLVIALIVWLNLPALLWPAFILTLVLLSVDRWRRGVYPWPPRKRPH
jgi:hypothetical protein